MKTSNLSLVNMMSGFDRGRQRISPLTMAACAAMILFAMAPVGRAQILLHYALDETTGTTAADSSGNGTDGSLMGFDFAANSVAAVHGTGLDFDGSNDYIDVGETFSTHPSVPDSDQNLTIMTWIKVDDWTNNSGSIAAAGVLNTPDPNNPANEHLRFSMGPLNGGMLFRYVNADVFDGGTNDFGVPTTVDSRQEVDVSGLSTTNFHHFAYTIDPNGIDTVFINGDPVVPINTTNAWGPGNDPHFTLGRRFPTSPRYFDGSLDDYAIIDGKLTESQIESIIANGVASLIGPVCDFEWGFDRSGDWTVGENWTPSGGPPGVPTAQSPTKHTVLFGDVIESDQTVFSNIAVSARAITFDNTNSYIVEGAGSVSLVQGTAAASPANSSITVVQGTHQFQLNVNLQNNTDVDVATAATLAFNNELFLDGNVLTKTGLGTLAINNNVVTGGGTLTIAEGTVSGNGTVGGDLNNEGGTISPGNSPGILTVSGNLNNTSGGTIAMEIEGTAGAGEALGHDQIQVTGGSTLDGTLSITTGAYTDPTTRAARDTFTLIASAGGSTGAFGTVSYDGTALSADFTGANGSIRDHINNGLFRNVNYDGSDVSLTNLFALEGDADGDIDIDITDFNILASNFDATGANSATNDWTKANFNGDAFVDITDFNFLAANFADTGYGAAVSGQVPEPASLLLLLLGGLLMYWTWGRRN